MRVTIYGNYYIYYIWGLLFKPCRVRSTSADSILASSTELMIIYAAMTWGSNFFNPSVALMPSERITSLTHSNSFAPVFDVM